MINTNYSSMYNQIMSAKNNTGKNNGRVKDKTHMSESMEYLAKAKAEVEKAKGAGQPKKDTGTAKKSDSNEITKEDIQKLYAELNGINYGEYDEKDSMKSMANSFLNEMVFSHMGSSKELFIPQISRNILSAAFNTAYDVSDVEERVRNASNREDKDNFEVDTDE